MNNKEFLSKGYDIVAFDCDSTLTGVEGVDLLAKRVNKSFEVEELTDQAMNGRVEFENVFSARLDLIKPKRSDLEWLTTQYIQHRIPDAVETIRKLQELGKRIYIVTGGYEIPVKGFAKYLGVLRENVFSVDLKFKRDENYFSYNARNVLTKNDGKRRVLEKLSNLGTTIFIGDGATDLAAKEAVDLFVGFGGIVDREIVRKNAHLFINIRSLAPMVSLAQGYKGRD